jgi:hypothetical protein
LHFKIHCKCCNFSFGLATKARDYKGVDQEWSPESEGECEGMNPHTPKWAPTLGVGVPMDSRIFKGKFQRSKFIGRKSFLYHWKSFKIHMFKMVPHDSFSYLKHKLWPKEGPWVKLPIWLLTKKSPELPWFTWV